MAGHDTIRKIGFGGPHIDAGAGNDFLDLNGAAIVRRLDEEGRQAADGDRLALAAHRPLDLKLAITAAKKGYLRRLG